MVYLSDIMDPGLLAKHVTNGLVSRRNHDSLPLTILNYTPECQFSRAWDEVTRKCRGLIYNRITGEVVARPFEKFGNWDESGYPFPPSGPALRMEKMDGSLGILWDYMGPSGIGTSGIATRGSFHSEQAQWATEFFHKNLDRRRMVSSVKTYLFEIIYPENRIVVDYGDYKGLVLLDVIDTETGMSDVSEFDYAPFDDKVKRHSIPSFDSGQVVDIPAGGEGFVFLWPTRNFRTKMKSAEYVEIHRMISNLSEKSVWEALCAGKTLDQIKVGLPEEFHRWIDDVATDIQARALDIVSKATYNFKVLEESGMTESRRDFAIKIQDHPLRKYLFMMLDNKPIYPVALLDSKPVKGPI